MNETIMAYILMTITILTVIIWAFLPRWRKRG
jgi:hypothetical protein